MPHIFQRMCPAVRVRYLEFLCTKLTDQYSGYLLNFLQESRFGLVAQLSLAGAPCNAFGTDFEDLTIQVTYETDSRYVLIITIHGSSI